MMGATILVVGLVGLIEAVLVGGEMQATARRQTLAAQIASNEIELLRLKDWATITALPVVTVWSPATAYHVGDVVIYAGVSYQCVAANSAQSPTNATYWTVSSMAWNPALTYHVTDVVSYAGTWYRCISVNANRVPGIVANAGYWTVYSGPIASSGIDSAATFGITRSISNLPNGLREVTLTVSWIAKPSGTPLSRTYLRTFTAYYGPYGLNLTYRRT